ncbi:MAG: peptide ABC transporter permease [Deltaproteobacteria bacterium]|nr:peptide ABC transporter permease [Deltaproteobacteria bacterium]
MNSAVRTILIIILAVILLPFQAAGTAQPNDTSIRQTIETLSSFGSRSTGSPGYEKAAEYVEQQLRNMGLQTSSHYYELPVRRSHGATLSFNGKTHSLKPFIYNAITPEATDGAISAPLYYVGRGDLQELDGKAIKDSIVLMDFDSGRNWQTVASLGARALIYLENKKTPGKVYFTEKHELSPLQFPCFWMSREMAKEFFGPLSTGSTPLIDQVELQSTTIWKNFLARNIYALIPGTDPELKQELIIFEAFFDNNEFIAGDSPGADAATSIATLLEVDRTFTENPPGRSVMVVATSGNSQTLAGMRDTIWSLNARSKEFRQYKRKLQKNIREDDKKLQLLKQLHFPLDDNKERDNLLKDAVSQDLKYRVDQISRHLMQLRLKAETDKTRSMIKEVAGQRLLLRRLGWAENFHQLPEEQTALLKQLIPLAITSIEQKTDDFKQQQKALKSAGSFRASVRDYEVAAIISFHLSSHGDGVGGFHRGWLYPLKQTINRTGIYSIIADILEGTRVPEGSLARYRNSLRPNRMRTWDSWFLDKPNLGGEVSSLAGYLGLSLVTTGDSRILWGTPSDTIDTINWTYLLDQARLIKQITGKLTWAAKLHSDKLPRDGFASLTARTNLLLQGELFADYPARKTAILAYQGLNKYYAIVDESGYFRIKGFADKKNVLDKLIIEGYRFDPKSGKVIWAIDKKETGKVNYRLKILRKSMKTDLVMFNCRETTIFDLLEPRSFAHMTKLFLYDGRRDAPPQHYWYSRIDTRDSIISSIYTEPGTMLKLTLSDTVLTNKMLLTNGSVENPMGTGYRVEQYPSIPNTLFHAARDAWTLLTPRINNLESHGIYDEKINSLKDRGLKALNRSREALASLTYSISREAAAESLALSARVYVQVEKTQKDVLFGVLFYIALFVPFAFVMERFLFSFAHIYKRIIGFSVILVLLIAIIYNVHPAFELAYSPMVVILAFFIIGLSFMVTLIIFFRFEDEMILLQRRSVHKKPVEISRWKAFVAAFFLGVSNLRRRRIRTLLTCSTLIILTFTIMSFTTIKSNQKQVRLDFKPDAPYRGLLLKKINWKSLPPQATDILVNSMTAISKPAPRIWLEGKDRTKPVTVPLRTATAETELHGLIGLSPNEAQVTGLDGLLSSGRWFNESDTQSIILAEQTAHELGVAGGGNMQVSLWGIPFTVIGTFKGETLDKAADLDGEPLTPVIFPDEAGSDISDAEQDALESGDDILSFQSRYQHIPANQTAIIPAETLLAAGGQLKSLAVKPDSSADIPAIAGRLIDRFNLVIFAGEEGGVRLYNISDTMNYSGVPNIIIPLLISILIVLNTMISSVYERKGEIAVYTSVGLAPSHVSFLFVAEAMALAVISVVIGYLVAQVSAAFLATTSLWQGITVNYSSMAGVAAMVLVIMVVLISVIYPSRVAARIAIPDVKQTFKLPAPKNNTIELILPFLMKYEERESIGGFIYNYLNGHQDISHGLFSTGPVQVTANCPDIDEIIKMVQVTDHPEKLKCLSIGTRVWLAPFDFGILQFVDLQFCPAREGNNFLEIKISMKRLSGESGIWQRISKSFVYELRKQLLIWRSIDEETHKQLQLSFQKIITAKDQSANVH